MSNGEQQAKQPEDSDLLSIQINIGDALQMQDISADRRRHCVKLIGYLDKKSVLVTHPVKDGKLLAASEGQGFLVRGFSDRKAYEFSADVINVCTAPYPCLHLSFPSRISVITMRGALRIKPRLECSVEPGAAAFGIPATIEDISTSGAKIRARKEIGKAGSGVTVNFRLHVDDEEHLFAMPALIRNIQSGADSDSGDKIMIYGVQFVQPEGKERMALQNFICKIMVEGQ
ncbi:MAG: flagellar brake protein [Gallionella sp.]|nr:MAG: flagellar brake protein [Gallionella sp.]